MAQRIVRKKWILYRHIRDFKLLCEIAKILKEYFKTEITKTKKKQLLLRSRDLGLYKARNLKLPLDAINHKINQLSYYMFGYQSEKRFMFSPLGNLFLKNMDNAEKSAKIFLTMLWSMQYEHPHSGTDKEFKLYPFRLIYKLLSDRRLDYKLYAFEVSYLIVFVKEAAIYEKLINEILMLRKSSDAKLEELFQKDPHAYVNSAYEWDYYVSTLFKNAGVLDKEDGDIICRLKHGKTSIRKIKRNSVTIPKNLFGFVAKLEEQYSFREKPLLLNDKERLREDVIKEIYSFYPEILLDEICEKDTTFNYLKLPKLIEQYANNPENETACLFEKVLNDGFNMFYNVKAKRMGGSGHTDIECLYLTAKKKFAVEAKSTANKLLSINAGRLKKHREEIGGKYTIVITPRYVPATICDIEETPNVIILANTFAEYLYNCMENEVRDIDYADFDNIIVNNLGKDISIDISNLTISKFATVEIKI